MTWRGKWDKVACVEVAMVTLLVQPEMREKWFIFGG